VLCRHDLGVTRCSAGLLSRIVPYRNRGIGIWLGTHRRCYSLLLSPVFTSNNVRATLSNATSRTILSTKSNVASTLLPFWLTMSNKILSFRQSRNKVEFLQSVQAKAPSTPATMSTLSKQHSTLSPKTATMSNEFIVKFSPFDNVECCFDIVPILLLWCTLIFVAHASRPREVQSVTMVSCGRVV